MLNRKKENMKIRTTVIVEREIDISWINTKKIAGYVRNALGRGIPEYMKLREVMQEMFGSYLGQEPDSRAAKLDNEGEEVLTQVFEAIELAILREI
jgi:hypothetical protein